MNFWQHSNNIPFVVERPFPTPSREAQHKPRESERIVESTTRSSTTKTVTLVANDTATNVTSDVNLCLGGIIDFAFEYIAAECAGQREM